MKFFRKSILWRTFSYFILLALLLGAVLFAFYFQGQQSVSLPVLGLIIFLFLFYFLLVYWYEIVRPLQAILHQMKALLTGRPYKKIYSKRLDEIGVIGHFFNEVTKNFESVSQQIHEGKRMLGELEIAAQIQKDILPLQVPRIPGLEVIAKARPAAELGGDNFDFITAKDNTFMYVGDVTGHGLPAALVMNVVHTLIHAYAEIYDNAYDIIVQTNRRLKTRIKSTMFMTLLMLRWNAATQKMTYVGAGHEHLLIYRVNKAVCDVQVSGGIALGMVADNSKIVKEQELPLEKGDIIVLYSDGITEARNMAGELYGLERLKKAVEQYAPQYGAEGLVYHISRDYSRFAEEHIQDDDVTLMAIQYTGTEMKAETSALVSTQWLDSDEKEKPEEKETMV